MSGRAYLSIGDVLTLLRQEFPDVTISKIRFLESQGLVNPERTPSGYRKFYDPDVERLRWVLRQQREHFLPLKVIKGRLEEVGQEGNGHHDQEHGTTAAGPAGPAPAARATPAPRAAPARAEPAASAGAGSRARGESTAETAPAPRSGRDGGGRAALPGFEGAQADAASDRAVEDSPAGGSEDDRPGETDPATAKGPRRAEPAAVLAEGDMTLQELAAASECPPSVLSGLESYGLVTGRSVGGTVYFGEDALDVARLAAAFAAFGVEPRHLRLHKHSAEREAGFIEQVVLPLLKQRNPESRRRAHDSVEELSRLGQELRAVLLRRSLRDQLGG